MKKHRLAFALVAVLAACGGGDDDNGGGGGGNAGDGSGGADNGGTDNGGTDSGGTDNGGADNGGTDNGGTDNGGTDHGGNEGSDGFNDGCGTTLRAIIRDFQASHPDFENDAFMHESGARNDQPKLGMVESTLGPDNKPVYAEPQPPTQSTGAAEFAQWYNDTPGVNMAFEYDIVLQPQANGQYVYDNQFFFPIDGKGFGAEGNDSRGMPRNFFFTTEIHTEFEYKGGEVFTFKGDDDLWLFINGKLAIDLGGLHPAVTGTVDLDARASELGIVKGNKYRMDIFHAERHTTDSTFRIETTIDCLVPVPVL